MTKRKIAIAIAAAALAGTCAIGGTLAWLTDTASTKNTFTIGMVDISISEPGVEDPSNIVLTPGVETVKNPTITVEDGSVDAYVFAKVYNNFPAEDLTINIDTTNWIEVDTVETDNVTIYRYAENVVTDAGALPAVFDNVKLSETVDFVGDTDEIAEYLSGKEITVTGYAIQADGLTVEEGDEAWEAAYEALVGENASALPALAN